MGCYENADGSGTQAGGLLKGTQEGVQSATSQSSARLGGTSLGEEAQVQTLVFNFLKAKRAPAACQQPSPTLFAFPAQGYSSIPPKPDPIPRKIMNETVQLPNDSPVITHWLMVNEVTHTAETCSSRTDSPKCDQAPAIVLHLLFINEQLHFLEGDTETQRGKEICLTLSSFASDLESEYRFV